MAIIGLPSSNNGGSGFIESQIKDIILAELIDQNSLIYNETLTVANTIDVVRRVEEALPTTGGYNLITQLSEFTDSVATGVLNGALDANGNGIIYQALNTMLEPGGSGIIYNSIGNITEGIIDSYATQIGVGNNGQPYYNVQESAAAVIENQLLLGGIIDVAIKAGGA